MKFVWLITDIEGDRYVYDFDKVIRCSLEAQVDNTFYVVLRLVDASEYAHTVDSRSDVRLIPAESFSWIR